MVISMYRVSVPVFVRMLNNLADILRKAAAHAEAKKIEPSVLLTARLYPDMFTLARQVQIATDQAKGGAARLAGVEPPKYEDNEATFDELSGRIDKVISFVKSISPEAIDGSEEREVTLNIRGQTMRFNGLTYLLNFVLPNFYFHIATAYDILRHNGVELGKPDFLGRT